MAVIFKTRGSVLSNCDVFLRNIFHSCFIFVFSYYEAQLFTETYANGSYHLSFSMLAFANP